MAPEIKGANWFKSSYSNGGGNCMEVADLTNTSYGAIAVHDSKDPNGPALVIAPEAFAAFIDALKADH